MKWLLVLVITWMVLADEYRQVAHAYEKLIGQHIDQVLAKELFDKSWLPDATIGLPRRPGAAQPK
jgi:hypothetical protein